VKPVVANKTVGDGKRDLPTIKQEEDHEKPSGHKNKCGIPE
jgi:hypothetical protein